MPEHTLLKLCNLLSTGSAWNALPAKLRGSGFNGGGCLQPFLGSHVQVPRRYCTRYHRGSHCSGCTYKHTCFKCTAGAHPAINCKRPRTAGSKGGPQSNGKIASHGTVPISAASSSPAPPVSATAGRVRTRNNWVPAWRVHQWFHCGF